MWVRWDSDVPTKHVKSLVKKQAFLKKRNDLTRKGYVLKVHKIYPEFFVFKVTV